MYVGGEGSSGQGSSTPEDMQPKLQVLTLATTALAIVMAVPLHDDQLQSEWSAFKLAHAKTFRSAADENARLEVFRSNLAYITTENAKNHSYTLGVTQFADMTVEEFEERFLGHYVTTRFDSASNRSNSSAVGLHQWTGEQLPAAVDWQAANATNPVQDENQNGCYGACYAFAAAGAIEGAYKIKTGKLIAVSEQQIVDCSAGFGNRGCGGGLMDYAYNYAMHTDLCTQSSYPYHGPTEQCSGCKAVAVARGLIKGHKEVAHDENSLMAAVAKQPVSVGLDGAWADTNAFRFYKSGVLSTDCGTKVDHGVRTSLLF